MPNGYGFEANPARRPPDAKRVGAMLMPEMPPMAQGPQGPTGSPAGQLVPTGGDGTGSPGARTPPPNLASMPTQSASPMQARPENLVVNGDFDPATEHSESATAAAVGDMLRRTDGQATGFGKVQNAGPVAPLQAYQLQRMGLSPAEIELLTMGGALKPQGV